MSPITWHSEKARLWNSMMEGWVCSMQVTEIFWSLSYSKQAYAANICLQGGVRWEVRVGYHCSITCTAVLGCIHGLIKDTYFWKLSLITPLYPLSCDLPTVISLSILHTVGSPLPQLPPMQNSNHYFLPGSKILSLDPRFYGSRTTGVFQNLNGRKCASLYSKWPWVFLLMSRKWICWRVSRRRAKPLFVSMKKLLQISFPVCFCWCCYCCICDKVYLCSLDWPGTLYINQAGLEVIEIFLPLPAQCWN